MPFTSKLLSVPSVCRLELTTDVPIASSVRTGVAPILKCLPALRSKLSVENNLSGLACHTSCLVYVSGSLHNKPLPAIVDPLSGTNSKLVERSFRTSTDNSVTSSRSTVSNPCTFNAPVTVCALIVGVSTLSVVMPVSSTSNCVAVAVSVMP